MSAQKVAPKPMDDSARLQKAESRYQAGDLQAAAELYREALAVRPDMTWIGLRLGVIAYRRGELEQAEAYFGQVLAREPNNQAALFDMGLLRIQQARDLMGRYLATANHRSPRYAEAQAVEEQFKSMGIAD